VGAGEGPLAARGKAFDALVRSLGGVERDDALDKRAGQVDLAGVDQ